MTITSNNSLTNYLELIKPKVDANLIAPQYWQSIETVAGVLPSAVTTFFGFECRLGIEEAHADFLICADAEEAGREILANRESAIALPTALYAHPVWQQIRDFSQQWNNPSSPLYNRVNNIWLEFDIDRPSVGIPVPSCFFAPQPIYADSDSQWTIDTALKLLQNRAVPEVIASKLSSCFELLPDDAYVFQIGVMLARKSDLARICIRNITPEQIPAYLTKIGWSGSVDKLQETLSELSKYAARIDLDIDVGESVLPKIGLECYLDRQPQFEPKWQLFLDYLVDLGFCTEQKRDSLLAYTGYIRGNQNPQLLPSNLERISNLVSPGCEGVFFKGLHHIKVTYQDAQPLEAKAYLYVSQQLIDPEFVSKFKTWNKNEQLVSS